MPHIEFATFASQIFWLILTFIAIYFIVSKRYVPSVAGAVIGRNRDIKRMVAKSEELDVQVKLLERDLMKVRGEMREKVSLRKSAAKKKADAILDEAAAKAQADIANIRNQQEEKLSTLNDDLSKEVSGIADQISKDVNDKIYNLYKFNVTKMNHVV